VPTARK